MMQTPIKTLYDCDFNLWIEETITQLKAKNIEKLDWGNLIEEIEALGKRDKRELENRLISLFEHALKYCYVALPDCYSGWEITLKRTQKELKKILRDSPSLKNYFLAIAEDCYQDAVDNLIDEYQVKFPQSCPFSKKIETLLTEKFWQ
jgi:hypothetical protein